MKSENDERTKTQKEQEELMWMIKLRHSATKHEVIDEAFTPQNSSMRGFLGRLSKNYGLITSGEEQASRSALAGDRRDPEEAEIARYPLQIEDAMLNRRAVSVVDTPVEERCVEAYWTVTNLNNEPIIEGSIAPRNWKNGSILVAPGLEALNLIRDTALKTTHMSGGEIVAHVDNKKALAGVLKGPTKEIHCAQEVGATIDCIMKEIQGATIDISLEYSNGKPRQDESFEQEPGPALIKECDE